MKKVSYWLEGTSLVISFIPVYFLLKGSVKITSLEIGVIVGIVIFLLFLFMYLKVKGKIISKIDFIENLNKKLDTNTKKLNDLEKELNYNKKILKLESKINIMNQNFNRKGSLDPIVIIIFLGLLLLVYLFLKANKILP